MSKKSQTNSSDLGSMFDEDVEPDPKDETLAALEEQVNDLSNRLYEERFIWILVSVVLVDIFVFSQMQNWSGPIVIGVFELIGIVILADRCQVDTVAPLIDKLAGFANKVTKNGND